MNTFNTETSTYSSVLTSRFGKRIEEIKKILTKLRDTLLPKLMYEELRITEASQLTEIRLK